MSWKFSRFTTSMMGLLRDPDTSGPDSRLEGVREALLASMLPHIKDLSRQPAVWSKVMYARDAQTLWFHRSDVMAVLCEHLGETQAREAMQGITEMFRGMVPAAQLKPVRRAPDRS